MEKFKPSNYYQHQIWLKLEERLRNFTTDFKNLSPECKQQIMNEHLNMFKKVINQYKKQLND